MRKVIIMTFVLGTMIVGLVSAGDIEEEHKKAEEGGYVEEYEKAMDEHGGKRTKDEHEKYHEEKDEDDGKNTKDGIDSDQGRANKDGTVRGSDDNFTVIKDDSTVRSNPKGQ